MNQYPINEIFYSLQGEGVHAGRPAVFVRFSGCNLSCPFCDTDHAAHQRLSAEEILSNMRRLGAECRFCVLTGGEPSLWVDEALIEALHQAGYEVAIETNGTRVLPAGIDWVTCSPKETYCANAVPVLKSCDELKLVFSNSLSLEPYTQIVATHRLLQPCDTGNAAENLRIRREAVAWCLAHPQWRLSLQQHKILDIQ